MTPPKHIPESEFRAFTRRRRQQLALDVARSGLTISEIAAGTRLKWDTVQRIANAQPVRDESQDRVRCYLENISTKP